MVSNLLIRGASEGLHAGTGVFFHICETNPQIVEGSALLNGVCRFRGQIGGFGCSGIDLASCKKRGKESNVEGVIDDDFGTVKNGEKGNLVICVEEGVGWVAL